MIRHLPNIVGLVIVLIFTWLLITPIQSVHFFVDYLDYMAYDMQLRIRAASDIKPSDSIAIIDIDDKSLQAIGRWPWPRKKVAELVNTLSEQNPAVMAFDIFFPEKERNLAEMVIDTLSKNNKLTPDVATQLKQNEALFNDDNALEKSFKSVDSVLAITFLPREHTENTLPPPILTLSAEEEAELSLIRAKGYIANIALFQNAAKRGGFINIYADSDGIMRHAPFIMEYQQGQIYSSLALQAVLTFFDEPLTLIIKRYAGGKRLEGVKIGSRVIPTDETGQVLIPFIGKSYTFPYFSAIDVLEHKIPSKALLGKILFIGSSATGEGDLHATAIQSPFPGVEIQATLANGILENNFSSRPTWLFGANIILVILLGTLASFIFPHLDAKPLTAMVAIIPLCMAIILHWAWVSTGILLSPLPFLLIFILAILNIMYGYLFESRRREHLKRMFGQYVPEKHIDEMLRISSDYGLQGEARNMSVLFADIRNFTSISEGLSPTELVTLLNNFLTPMTEIIFNHHGTIDKYVGDLIMAFWGAPLKDRQHPRHAIASAIEMQKKIKDLAVQFKERNWPDIKIGIGINTGMMNIGDMGSHFRRNYTVLGDEVNLASRIEGLTKFYGVDIIVTENTQLYQTKFVFRQLDIVKVKGKQRGIAIFEALCLQEEITPDLYDELETYHLALEYYFNQNWEEADRLMHQLNQSHPKKIYSIYIERIAEFKIKPPPAEWDGIYVHTVK